MAWIYAVASAKGGVGKTTTTASLSAALSAAGHDVAVVDADLAMPNLAAALGVTDTDATVHDVLAGRASVADATYTADAGVDVLPGDDSLDAFAAAEPTELHAVLSELDSYDFVLVDTGSGLSHDAVLPLGLADAVFLVCNTERDALGDTDKTREVTERLGGTVAGVVLTRVDPENPNAEEVAARLDATVVEAIPADDAVTEAVAASTPVAAHAPDSPAATAYGALAEAVESYDHSAADETVDGESAVDTANESDESDESDELSEAIEADESDATDPTPSDDVDDADAATGALSIASAEAKLGIDADGPVAFEDGETEAIDDEDEISDGDETELDVENAEPVADAIAEAENADEATDVSETEAEGEESEVDRDDEDGGVYDTALVAEAETAGLGVESGSSSENYESGTAAESSESPGPNDPAQSGESVDSTDGQNSERGDEETGEAESESGDGKNTGFLGRLLR
ncbi:hypothetical protein AUR64_06220 [Haloprofundus marisrubri]|uniref:CobQ/CobB/MinD/ParA nucleotide binding domain-containing protein n=1 Tax=Haloprofundus marisrubri TaxID=1514971 RepID=A0A0W1RCC6_9EURY|nr:MinD/ParA family protein [Haloprofundus marisrubri]KTG10783.1 hypothetical protein AUR64_06220 [Haloprofundus marisrubri]